jgi:hypothetical protein
LTFEQQIKALYLVPYRDLPHLKTVIHEASREVQVSPIFVDEIMPSKENIVQAVRALVLSCDIVVGVMTRHVPAGIILETTYVESLNKPFIMFARRPVIPFFHPRMRYLSLKYNIIYYETLDDLRHHLSLFLAQLRTKLKKPCYSLAKEEENKLTSILEQSMKTNVLVLGKDSDPEGIRKIDRISTVLKTKGYNPVLLKKLPEIKYLSLEGKATRVGALTRFVIAEDSRPSGHIDEVNICARCEYVTATLREIGAGSTWMQAHYPIQYNFMNRFCYRNGRLTKIHDSLCDKAYETLEESAEKAIAWAEKRIAEQEREFSRRIYSNF